MLVSSIAKFLFVGCPRKIHFFSKAQNFGLPVDFTFTDKNGQSITCKSKSV